MHLIRGVHDLHYNQPQIYLPDQCSLLINHVSVIKFCLSQDYINIPEVCLTESLGHDYYMLSKLLLIGTHSSHTVGGELQAGQSLHAVDRCDIWKLLPLWSGRDGAFTANCITEVSVEMSLVASKERGDQN